MNVTIPIADRILTTTEWSTFNPSVAEYKFPILFKIADGASQLYLYSYTRWWIPASQTANLLVNNTAQKHVPAPNAGISELTLLRAIAVANDPSLIKDMT